jgi:hypothetical protein
MGTLLGLFVLAQSLLKKLIFVGVVVLLIFFDNLHQTVEWCPVNDEIEVIALVTFGQGTSPNNVFMLKQCTAFFASNFTPKKCFYFVN